MNWDDALLKPLAVVAPEVCEVFAHLCEDREGQPARWAWGAMAMRIGDTAVDPAYAAPKVNCDPPRDPATAEPLPLPFRVRFTEYGQDETYRITEFRPHSGAYQDGTWEVQVVYTVTTTGTSTTSQTVALDGGCETAAVVDDPSGAPYRQSWRNCGMKFYLAGDDTPCPTVIHDRWALLLPEHVETVTPAGGPADGMTGATLLMCTGPPARLATTE